jgi:hypothetical protein
MNNNLIWDVGPPKVLPRSSNIHKLGNKPGCKRCETTVSQQQKVSKQQRKKQAPHLRILVVVTRFKHASLEFQLPWTTPETSLSLLLLYHFSLCNCSVLDLSCTRLYTNIHFGILFTSQSLGIVWECLFHLFLKVNLVPICIYTCTIIYVYMYILYILYIHMI